MYVFIPSVYNYLTTLYFHFLYLSRYNKAKAKLKPDLTPAEKKKHFETWEKIHDWAYQDPTYFNDKWNLKKRLLNTETTMCQKTPIVQHLLLSHHQG